MKDRFLVTLVLSIASLAGFFVIIYGTGIPYLYLAGWGVSFFALLLARRFKKKLLLKKEFLDEREAQLLSRTDSLSITFFFGLFFLFFLGVECIKPFVQNMNAMVYFFSSRGSQIFFALPGFIFIHSLVGLVLFRNHRV